MVNFGFYTIRAKIYVLATHEGGRQTPFIAGYHPFFCSFHAQGSGFIHPLPGEDWYKVYELGREYIVDIRLLCPVRVSVGEKFSFQEGSKIVATGDVLAILDDPCNAAEDD